MSSVSLDVDLHNVVAFVGELQWVDEQGGVGCGILVVCWYLKSGTTDLFTEPTSTWASYGVSQSHMTGCLMLECGIHDTTGDRNLAPDA